MSAGELVARVYGHHLRLNIDGPAAATLWHDGRVGHAVGLAGVDRESWWLRYRETPSGEVGIEKQSLLCRENNLAGVAAVPLLHPPATPYATWRTPNTGWWLVNPHELMRVIVAVLIPTSVWEEWSSFEQRSGGALAALTAMRLRDVARES